MPWTTVSTNSELTAIHAALLPTEPDGVILYYGDWAASGGGAQVQNLTFSRMFRLAPGLADPIETFPDDALPDTDCFCGGQSFLADGRLLSGGGTYGWANSHEGIHLPHYDGERACWIYLPRAKRWVRAGDLNFQPGSASQGGGRWYPTLTTLANGEVFAAGGHPAGDDHYPVNASQNDARHNNNSPERYSPGADSWALMTTALTAPDGFAYETDGYPRFRALPNGLLFSDTAGDEGPKRIFNPYAGVWTGPDIGGLGTLPDYYNRGSAATSVLLPLLPPFYRPRILATNSPDDTAFRIDVDDTPTWVATAPRTGSAAGRSRTNACATLLPTGQVLVTGGWPGNAGADDPSEATLEPELYTPGINWAAGDFSDTDEEQWETLNDPAPTRRGYHSCALLLPDGRVWHGGSTTTFDGANRNFELFEPAYFNDNDRPTITDCPGNIGYLAPFYVATPDAEQIERVALMRCGSITHGFDSDQRYVGLQFNVWTAGALEIFAPMSAEIAPPGYYMLFLIDNQGRVCERASFIRLSRQKLVVSADISTYSIQEVDALGPPSTFEQALFVTFDGFMPHEIVPISHRLFLPNGEDAPDIEVSFGTPAYEAGSDKADIAQRVTYPVRLRFTSLKAFDAIPDDEDFIDMTFAATAGLFQADVTLQLSKNPNPRMRDGDPPWLSVDLRVFKANPNDAPLAGIEHPAASGGASAAYQYIRDVLAALNDPDGGAGAAFDTLPVDQEVNRLELGTNDANGDPVFNYAVARVRYVAPEGIDATDVRLFFRMWTTGWSALEFDTNASYRRFGNGASATPLLGLEGGEINNVPCFAQLREADMRDQEDPTNRRTLAGAGANEVFAYFGCWLDVNQNVGRFPLAPQSDGPFDDGDDPEGLRSIQQLMRGLHQCLVAEIHYTQDPIPPLATPGSSDNIAQRNILFDYSDNPGGFASHLVHHTFELKPSPVSFAQSVLAPNRPVSATRGRLHPDELVIDWGNLPRDALVTFYMPQVDAREIVRASAARQSPGNLSAAAADTLRCKVTDVGYIPIPGPLDKTIAGLMTVQLPPGVQEGKVYRIVFRQVSGRTLKVLGSTEFRIEVRNAATLLPRFEHNLAVLKHVAASIPASNRWHPVFKRYLAELGDRVRAFGGDPEAIDPNPNGTSGAPPTGKPTNPGDKGRTFCVTGEIERLHYDCCGKLKGFTLADCDRSWHFDNVQDCLEQVLLTGLRDRLRATVRARQGRSLDAAINPTCPWSGRPISADALTHYEGHVVGFCSPRHRDRFAAALAAVMPAQQRRSTQRIAPLEPFAVPAIYAVARTALPLAPPDIPEAQRREAEHDAHPSPAKAAPPAQSMPKREDHDERGAAAGTPLAVNSTCPFSGKPVSDKALTQFRGKTLGFCSPGHRNEFDAAIKAFDALITRADGSLRDRPLVEGIDLHR